LSAQENAFVMEAKRQVYGTVGIDFLAGPSECMVIADETGGRITLPADLLASANMILRLAAPW